MVNFRYTTPASDKNEVNFYFYAGCLRAIVSKLADTMDAHT